MADVFGLLAPDGSVLFASRKPGGWSIDDRVPDAGPRGRRLCIFVIGTEVLSCTAAIPARSESEAYRAAPFAIEDELGEPVETLHVALGAPVPGPEKLRRVQVVSRRQMQVWLDLLKALGLEDASLVAAHCVLPDADGLYECDEVVLGRLGSRSFGLDRAIGGDVFLGLTDGRGVAVHGERLARDMGAAPAGPGIATAPALLVQLAEWASGRALVDLRAGAFGVRTPFELKGFARWQVAAVFALALLVGSFAQMLLETHGLNQRAAIAKLRTAAFVSAGWPDAGGDASLITGLPGTLTGEGAPAIPSALSTLAVLYAALEQVPGSQLRSVRYDRQRGELAARVAFNDYAEIDRLAAEIQQSGLAVAAGDARQSGARIIGELVVGPRR